ncbi:MAG: 2-dehydropantoate 2-reductase [Bacteroidota bacterium]
MKIAILGSGGAGGYFGARLAKAGHEVHFLARGAHLAALQRSGIQINSINGDFSLSEVHATDKIEEIGPVDLMFMGVKSWQLKGLAEQAKVLLKEDTSVIPLQNGVMAYEELQEVYGGKHVLGGTCRIISKITAPGHIHHFSVDPLIHFGEWDNKDSKRIHEIAEILRDAGIRANPCQDIQVEIWKKFIIICTSALLAVGKASYGQIMEQPESRQLLREMIEEIHALALKMNIHIEEEYLDQSMEFMDSFAYDATASLARDIWEGKHSELEYQNGSVVRLAEKHGVAVPINRFVYYALLPAERKTRGL